MYDEWKAIQGQLGGLSNFAHYLPQPIPQLPMERLKQEKEFIMNKITEDQKKLELVEQAIVALEASPITETLLNFLIKLRIL